MRLDQYLLFHNLVASRARAQRLVKAAKVSVNQKICTKMSMQIKDSDQVILLEADFKWASRGAFKLEKALDYWNISIKAKNSLDVGASTGGFTQLLLDRGASKVYSLDVGHGQLVDYLREDDRVVVLERTDIRSFETEERFEMIAVDVSFISLKLIIPSLAKFLSPAASLVLLIKPQFEVGPQNINNRGIVKNKELYKIVKDDLSKLSEELGFSVVGIIDSPIEGGDGNQEFLMHLEWSDIKI